MSIRDKIIKAGLFSEIVYIPEWDVKVEVRASTVKQQYALIDKTRKGSDGEVDGMMYAVEKIMATTFDPDTGELVFDNADRDMLLDADSRAFNILLSAANRALGEETEDEIAGRLKENPDAETSTG